MQQTFAAMLVGGYVLLEDIPGVGKTTLSYGVAAVLGLGYWRAQFTDDMLPSDSLGINVSRPDEGRFEFHSGPVFHVFLLADEINRALSKLRSALPGAMEERQVSVDGETHPLPQLSIVTATQNPIKQLGTFPLPESQLDHFMIHLSMNYPAVEAEEQLYLQSDSRSSAGSLQTVHDVQQLQQWWQQISQVMFAQAIADYVYRLMQAMRQSGRFAAGLSPRAGLVVVGTTGAQASMQRRGYVLPDDVKSV